MARNTVDGAQNVEVSRPIEPELSPEAQLALMERYTQVHHEHRHAPKALREVACLEVQFPALFRSLEEGDLIAGRLDVLPIGFGSVTSVGGVAHYCVFHKLRALKDRLPEKDHGRVDALYDYWTAHDAKALFCADVLSDEVGRFIDPAPALMATVRLSGMLLDYKRLCSLGLPGLRVEVAEALVRARTSQDGPGQDHLLATLRAFDLFEKVIERQAELCEEALTTTDNPRRRRELCQMLTDLKVLVHEPPATFRQALQLLWLYALCAGCINYGRLDDVLGPFLAADIAEGRIDEEEAFRVVKSLWTLVENRRTTVNGRIMVGGAGREDPEAADVFGRLCLRACAELRYVEPQFTFRLYGGTPDDMGEKALECIAAGATYPTLYNDEVNVAAVMESMGVTRETAEAYAPFGCGEFVIQGKSVGTPNILSNLMKLLQISLNRGIDPMDGVDRSLGVALLPPEKLTDFETLWDNYLRLVDRYLELGAHLQAQSYRLLAEQASFLFVSALMDDCTGRARALLDGGVEILGGTNETYGNINASDSLVALKSLVYDQGRYGLQEVLDACWDNFGLDDKGAPRTDVDPAVLAHHSTLRRDLLAAPKYGNDDEVADAMADRLFRHVARVNDAAGKRAGLDNFLIVISNNQTNTDWGHGTAAGPDGRLRGLYMNPANNPQAGAAKSGPTAMLKSLTRFDAGLHGGSVQNLKLDRTVFRRHPREVAALMDAYFRSGGCQLMVTSVDAGELEDAQVHPEAHRDLLVRVAGYSARFCDLTRDVQDELISRELHRV